MTAALDDDLVQRIDHLGHTTWTGTAYRYTASRRDPLSGAGARLFGGRWNPKDIFATIYLASPVEACAGEVERAALALGTVPEIMLKAPYLLHTVEAKSLRVLDLRGEPALAQVGLSMADILDDDWTACQTVGHAAWFLEIQGILVRSASGAGMVVAAFESHLTSGQLSVTQSQDFTPDLYATIRP